jgi:hypothetical protein
LGPELAPKRDQKWDHFWNPLPPPLRGPNDAILRIKRECCKSYCDWNYIRQKKGRDKRILSCKRQSASQASVVDSSESSGKSQKEGKGNHGWIKEPGGLPLNCLKVHGPPGLPSSSSGLPDNLPHWLALHFAKGYIIYHTVQAGHSWPYGQYFIGAITLDFKLAIRSLKAGQSS